MSEEIPVALRDESAANAGRDDTVQVAPFDAAPELLAVESSDSPRRSN